VTTADQYLTTSEVAALLRVDASTVRDWAKRGKLSATTLPGGHYRFNRADVDALTGERAA
jgi:excisionase family DNA binding protein